MLKYIHVKPETPDLRAIVLAGEAEDANLTSCLLYLLVGGDSGGMVEVSNMAEAYGVGDFTITRWLRRLSKLGLIVVRLSGDGMLELDVKLRVGLGPVENPPVPKVYAERLERLGGSGDGFDATQGARLVAAWEAFVGAPTMAERSAGTEKIHAMRKMLEKVVKNALFDGLNLPDEIRHADAWVIRKPYKDMPKFLMNWLRREAAKKKPFKNTNAAPAGKYAAAQAAARGR